MQAKYKRRKVEGRSIDEHRLVYEQIIGRRLGRWEFIHHINGDKKDNRIENLELVTPAVHAARHGRWKHKKEKQCEVCKRNYTPHPTKRKRSKTCSPECKRILMSIINRRPNKPNSMYNQVTYPSRKKARILVPHVAAAFVNAYMEDVK